MRFAVTVEETRVYRAHYIVEAPTLEEARELAGDLQFNEHVDDEFLETTDMSLASDPEPLV